MTPTVTARLYNAAGKLLATVPIDNEEALRPGWRLTVAIEREPPHRPFPLFLTGLLETTMPSHTR